MKKAKPMSERPLSYRAEIIEPLLQSIVAGECCSVIGISGVGKSNLIQQLQRPAVLEAVLGADAAPLRFVLLDANLMANWSPWGFFEGLIEALLTNLGSDLPAAVQELLQERHSQILTNPQNQALALRHCAAAIAQLCSDLRLVLLFDEFDTLFTQLAGSVLRNLRGLRDRHKYRLIFVTLSRQRLMHLRDEEEWDAVEPFVELLSLRELGLGPLGAADAADEVARFAARHRAVTTSAQQRQIVELSGGHPALVRALTQFALLTPQALSRGAELHQEPQLRLECVKIWEQLTTEEQDDLLPIAYGTACDPRQVGHLLLKGLVRTRDDGVLTVFSPLMRAYLTSFGQSGGHTPAIWMDPQRKAMRYYGRDVCNEIVGLGYDLLAYLWERPGQICDQGEVARAIYPDEEILSLEPLRLVAKRLRTRLEELAPGQPVPFRIHRRHGYQLIME